MRKSLEYWPTLHLSCICHWRVSSMLTKPQIDLYMLLFLNHAKLGTLIFYACIRSRIWAPNKVGFLALPVSQIILASLNIPIENSKWLYQYHITSSLLKPGGKTRPCKWPRIRSSLRLTLRYELNKIQHAEKLRTPEVHLVQTLPLQLS
jgi:hypothetical protein